MQKRSLSKKKLEEESSTSSGQFLNIDEVVTRRILNEELEVRDYVTKTYLYEELERRDYVTKSYLHEEMTTQRKEYERYAGAWAENIQSQMGALAEMLASVAENMTSVKEWIKEDHYRVHTHIDFRLNALEASAGHTS